MKPQPKIKQKTKKSYNEIQQSRAHENRLDNYHERQTQIFFGKSNFVCFKCRKTFKLPLSQDEKHLCPNCGKEILNNVGIGAKVPRKGASDKVWKAFSYLFNWEEINLRWGY